MDRSDQIAESKQLLAHIAQRTTSLADDVYRLNVTDYTCLDQAAREREVFFRKGAINVGLSCLLPNPGDSLTHDWTGVPILIVRQADRSLRAFLNVCRHRGARIAEGRGDAFAGGFLAGYVADPDDLARALALGGAAQALKHTMPGDFLIASRAEVEAAIVERAGGVLQR